MPLYEYQCILCNERVEVIQRHNDPPYSHCPKCGGDMKKLLSAPAIQFKGSGFYKTDYPSSNGRTSSSSSSTEKTGESKAAPSPAASSTDKSGD